MIQPVFNVPCYLYWVLPLSNTKQQLVQTRFTNKNPYDNYIDKVLETQTLNVLA
jgi:hypothetical protein